MSEGQEQNRTEEATPHSLRKAREKGQVARGMDLGFVGALIAVAMVALVGGQAYFARVAEVMGRSLGGGAAAARGPAEALGQIGGLYWLVLQPLVVLGATVAALLIALEIVQLRGFIFTAQPLKPDFTRLNPAKGLKRVFSLRMLKETLKNVLKMAVYSAAAWFIVAGAVHTLGPTTQDASRLSNALAAGTTKLLFVFIAIATVFMLIDQFMVRREFGKQMRMSRRDVTRESRDREGEPRFKQRRREIHAQMRAQSEGLGKVEGSDFLVVNPSHYAVALKYDAGKMDAPEVRAMGRDNFAQLLKRKARLLGIPVLTDAALARALFADARAGRPIPSEHYRAVAALYRRIARNAAPAPAGD